MRYKNICAMLTRTYMKWIDVKYPKCKVVLSAVETSEDTLHRA